LVCGEPVNPGNVGSHKNQIGGIMKTLRDFLEKDIEARDAMFDLLQGFVKKGQKAQTAVDKIIKDTKKRR